MECFQCLTAFDRGQHLPKILIKCGHTLCSSCIQQQVESLTRNSKADEGVCFECGTPFPIESEFPVNLALLAFTENLLLKPGDQSSEIIQDSNPELRQKEDQVSPRKRIRIQSTFSVHSIGASSLGPAGMCGIHQKKLEAFCEQDKKVLCIDCILSGDHKSHEILSLDRACTKEKQAFEAALASALSKESEVQHQIHRIQSHMSDLESQANSSRGQVSKLFNQIRAKLIERETTIKRRIADILEKE